MRLTPVPPRAEGLQSDALSQKRLPKRHHFRVVHAEHLNGCSTHRGLAHQFRPVPAKVILPAVLTRMEERDHVPGFRIDPRDVRPLVRITVAARVGEVLKYSFTAMLFGDNVFQIKTQHTAVLWKTTVLAPPTGAV